MLNREQLEQQQEQLRLSVRELPDERRKQFHHAWQKQVKDPDSYAVLNYLMLAGLHHFYLAKWLRGLLNLGISLVALLLMLGGVWQWGLAMLIAITVVELPALFRSELMVLQHNNQKMQALLKQLKEP
ncbi:TM2 domain-containing protein [Agarivorans sp. 1_MG-2023]|uniref:TM2 domain-containing protein n=1 Tax=Agarivorans sp. 1_MG-2023 TaxID=3062634 RepID=UPI0026E145A8|nr:TM2 domain-containing protein [Agarivorans sp. 1_MG-2023]MDO6765517.1 TM2 domain-containing protein [Agarivorans sp. 1_MG-2023]